METLARFIQPIVNYPFATGIHWILMAVAGYLVATCREQKAGQLIANSKSPTGVTNTGTIHDRPRPIVISVSMIAFWISYEIAEFARIHDTVELDIAQGFAAYLVGAFGTLAYHKWRKH